MTVLGLALPYPVKAWVNGHEWVKQQACKLGLGFAELSNGFASCEDAALLQRICDRFGPGAAGRAAASAKVRQDWVQALGADRVQPGRGQSPQFGRGGLAVEREGELVIMACFRACGAGG
jgi:hypothetical protein